VFPAPIEVLGTLLCPIVKLDIAVFGFSEFSIEEEIEFKGN
jgi:hypothetical protein